MREFHVHWTEFPLVPPLEDSETYVYFLSKAYGALVGGWHRSVDAPKVDETLKILMITRDTVVKEVILDWTGSWYPGSEINETRHRFINT